MTEEIKNIIDGDAVRVLIVDDSQTERMFLHKLLLRAGVRAELAESGNKCIALTDAKRYDLILMDEVMPGIGGAETMRKLRTSGISKNRETPAVLLGAQTAEGGEPMFAEAGFVNYLEKPVVFKMLLAALLLYLPKDKLLSGEEAARRAKEEEAAKDASQDASQETAGIPAFLHTVTEINLEAGLQNCGTEENYLSALRIFYDTIEKKAEEIETFFREGDIENYTIKVHALKSSARIIGATDLSERAKRLEDAGNQRYVELIEEETEPLLYMYRNFRKLLKEVFAEPEKSRELPPVPPEMLNDAYASMSDFAEQMDDELMDMVLKSLREYSLSDEDEKIIAQIEEKLAMLDWDGIQDTLSSRIVENMEMYR